jgi:hypothetical protein
MRVLAGRNAGLKRALFGYWIPYLPDFLADHTLLGQANAERIAEILSRWSQFVLGLRKWQGSAFALRFVSKPEFGAIDVQLLGRMMTAANQADNAAQGLAADLDAQLTAFGIAHQPMTETQLHAALFPVQQPAAVVEVRQHEESTPFLTVHGEAYVIHPFWAPAGSWLLPFEAMLRQPVPVAVSLYLEPTELLPAERQTLAEAAHIAQTLADQQIRVHSDTTARQRRDPQAELVGRIYATLLRQLAEPFLLTIQVASANPSVAWTVARAFGSAITSDRETSALQVGERELPTGFDVRAPRNEVEAAAARRCFVQLLFSPWGSDLATEGKERLVHLVGAKGAASAFRFPVSVRGGIPGVAVRQSAPDFEPGPRPHEAGADELHLGTFRRGGAVTAKLQHLARHTLITGFTGAGKTNTVLYMLDQLWNRHRIPFLVIEAAKKEYRSLIGQPGFEDLLVFTLGDETTSPFRLNPFELLTNVRLEAHLGGLQACFDAALPQFGILPSIVAESLELVYQDQRWKLTDRGGAHPDRLFPTMQDMYGKVIQVAESRGYAGETYHNIRAAAAGRIGSLLRGSRGRMFSCQRSVPFDLVMTRPVVLELNDLNQQDKAMTMMFLLTLLREYRELHKSKRLQHLTVIEEAHNVMENVASVGASEIAADTRAKAVEAFAAMLAEVRAYGEGVIISDQSPEKLAPDAVRNTNLQIAHQLRHRADRHAIAAAMIMDEAQQEYLGKLRVGEAAVFLTGYDRATFMQVPNYKDEAGLLEPTDEEVAAHMAAFRTEHVSAYLPFDGCRFCGRPCDFREAIEPWTLDRELTEDFGTALSGFDEHPEPTYWPENWQAVARVCAEAGRRAGHGAEIDAWWCYLAHEIDFSFTPHMRRQFEQAGEAIRG